MKRKVSIAITPTAIANLDAIACKLDISRSELVEQIGRGIIELKLDGLPNNPVVAVTSDCAADAPPDPGSTPCLTL